MAWLQVHQELRTHRKVLAAAEMLRISTPEMIGHLVLLWCWALDNAPDGSLASISASIIAAAAIWPKAPDRFVDAMTAVGLLDRDERTQALSIHDWVEYTGRLIERRQAEKCRSRRRRAAAVARATAGQPQADHQPTSGQPQVDHQPTAGREEETIVKYTIPSLAEVASYCAAEGLSTNPRKFVDYYEARGWQIDGQPIANWQAELRVWEHRERERKPHPVSEVPAAPPSTPNAEDVARMQQLRKRLKRGDD